LNLKGKIVVLKGYELAFANLDIRITVIDRRKKFGKGKITFLKVLKGIRPIRLQRMRLRFRLDQINKKRYTVIEEEK